MNKKIVFSLIGIVLVLGIGFFVWRFVLSKEPSPPAVSENVGVGSSGGGTSISRFSGGVQISTSSAMGDSAENAQTPSSSVLFVLDKEKLPKDQQMILDAVLAGGMKVPKSESTVPPIDSGIGSTPGSTSTPVASLDEDVDGDGLTASQELQAKTNSKKADTDGDGLSDGDELRRTKTDPNNADTDGDELTDGEESLVYHTQPLLPDTDGDGYTDGKEVQSGYNPLGKGKL